jgi:serine/threonine-protein kinase
MRQDSPLGGRYRLVERLGVGGMSVVWRGFDEVLGRQVAVKVLAGRGSADPSLRERLRVEAQAAARLSHPNITNVYDYGETPLDGGSPVPYVVMELVDGEPLATHLAGGAALPWESAASVCAEVAGALAAAHARGVVHRDVTPGNVMLTPGGVKVVDFGISALIGDTDVGLDGSLLGTPAYLAPERLDGGQVSPATDVYALGLLLYRSLTGHLPWRAATTTQMLRAHRYEEPGPLPEVAGLPDEIAELCRRCLAKAPDERPTSAEVAAGLAEAAGIPVPVSPAGRTAPATALLPGRPEPGTTILPGRALALPTTAAVTGAAPRALRRSRAEAVLIAAGLLLVSGLVWASTGESDPGSVLAAPAPAAGVGAAPRSCRVEYRTHRDSGAAFTADVTVTNTAAEPVDDWRLEFELAGDQRVTATTSAAWEQSGRTVVVRSTGADRRLDPGASARLTLAGAYRTANPLPLAFGLNDDPCEAVVVGALGASSAATTGGTGAGVQIADRGGNAGRGKSGHGSDGKDDGGSDRGGKDKD